MSFPTMPFPRLAAITLAGLATLLALSLNWRESRREAREAQASQARLSQEATDRKRLQALEEKAAASYEDYRREANGTLDELTRVQAATETGLNSLRYADLLGQVNYSVTRFKEHYAGRVESRFASYRHCLTAMEAYVASGRAWRNKIESDYQQEHYEEKIQQGWRLADLALTAARATLRLPAGREEWCHRVVYQDYLGQATGSQGEAAWAFAGRERGQSLPDDQQACQARLAQLITALETWSLEHEGRYPAGLAELVPAHLLELPRCPTDSLYDLESTAGKGPPDAYTVLCLGVHCELPDDLLQATSQQGIVVRRGVFKP